MSREAYTRHDAEADFGPPEYAERRIQRAGLADVMYSFYGQCSHCVPIGSRGADGIGIAVCGTEVWLGTGSQGEWNRARRQPMCLRCTEWQQKALARRESAVSA